MSIISVSLTTCTSLRHISKPMAREASQAQPPSSPPTDAAKAALLHTHSSSIVTTTTAAAASRAVEALSSAIDATNTPIDGQDAELQTRVRTPRVLRKPRMTLAAVDAILAGEDPIAVLPLLARKPPLAKTPAPVVTRKPPVKKRRGRDVPGVEWDESLFHFANCVRIELGELNADFVANVRLVMVLLLTGGRVLSHCILLLLFLLGRYLIHGL